MGEQTRASHWGHRRRTALHRAAMVGNSETMSALIQGGCAVDLQDRDGNTALHEASWHGFSLCVKLLVKAGADVDVRNKAGNIPLHLASLNSHVPSLRLLLLGGSSIDAKNNTGETCLHMAARYDNRDVVKLLVSSQCSLTEKNERGDTALHVAAALNHKKTVQLLLEAGIDANLRNNAGRTALDKARENNHRELAVLLARAPQVRCFLRGRTVKKQRERQRSQSACRVEAEVNQTLAEQGSSSATEDVPSVEPQGQSKSFKTHRLYPERATNPVSHGNRTTREQEDKVKIRVEKNVKNRDRKHHLFDDADDAHLQFGKSYQLYTLYRDKDGNVRQLPANGCHCKPLFKKLENELKSTQEEMRLQILNVQEEINSRIGQMDRRNREQIKVVDLMNTARAAAERRHLMFKMEEQAALGREEARITQACVRGELQSWCVSQLKNNDTPTTPTSAPYCKLLHSPPAGQSSGESELESLPLLSVLSRDSSTSLATYVNIAPSWSSCSLGSEQETSSRKYFEMKVDRSPGTNRDKATMHSVLDDYENAALFPLPGSNGRLSPAATSRRPVEVQDTESSGLWSVRGEGFGSSSSVSCDCAPRWVPPKGRSQEPRRQELVRVGHEQDTTIEIYMDHPPTEPTFTQERSNLHAVEVTQRFFETVSSQLELWYERKILEVERQTEVQAQRDKQELLQRISTLEAELKILRANESTDDTTQERGPELQD
ncbi:ankyrin repeat domain-containing protein 6 [Periophthalmus magnuspinnatus]|uniref:ankyrin repeat domain-containing protein 6 n=1 Tax=Periophthalmus magnuspinnatus TaxID=409849 RepID=UPI00145B246B|nr:ankyrin repeat domain-containing protein 6 [Periophthalmus magnuspinnatus]